MGDDLASAIAATQEQLGGLFQKPRLTEKLLSKAPFRFLHDVVSAVTASTGFAAGLYSGEELDSGTIKDKASKLAYLDKIIALVGICSGHDIDVRPNKVVAGLEPEGTNALLTALGKCAKSEDLDFNDAVRRTLSGERPGQTPPPLRAAGGAGDGGGRRDSRGARDGVGLVDTAGGLPKAEAKGQDRGGGGEGGGRRGSGDGEAGTGGGVDEKASAIQEMEQMGQAAKALGVPQSRRLSSRAGGSRAEAKSRSNSLGTGGLGDDHAGIGGRDLTPQIEACTGEISVTREMLEAIISRPKLSDKLLNMPPFRFLHDIVSEVTRQTGFGQGLYSAEESDSSLVKAKPAKMAYLDKLIMLVGTSLNTLVDARPAKIVAGLEAENTNRMLQLLALAAVEKPDSSKSVAIVLDTAPLQRRSSTGSEGGATAATAATAAAAAAAAAAAGSGERDRQEQQQQQQQQRRSSSASSDANATAGATGAAAATAVAAERGGSRGSSAGEAKGEAGSRHADQDPAEAKAGGGARDTGPAEGSEAPRSMRPRTARRRPPTLKDNTKGFADKGRAQVPDEATAAPKLANINIMMDGDEDLESDDEEVTEGARIVGGAGGAGAGAKGEGHTAMVADILKEKERAESRAKEADAEAKGKGGGQEAKGSAEGGNGGGGIRMGRLRDVGRRSSANSLSSSGTTAGSSKLVVGGGGGYGDADVAKLKGAIQTLCQSTHPLGKCMDFVHEDLSLMSQEMDRWRALHKVKAEALESERAATAAFLQPLESQLRDLDDQLKESCMKIDGVKAGISVNDKKINSLLKMMASS